MSIVDIYAFSKTLLMELFLSRLYYSYRGTVYQPSRSTFVFLHSCIGLAFFELRVLHNHKSNPLYGPHHAFCRCVARDCLMTKECQHAQWDELEVAW